MIVLPTMHKRIRRSFLRLVLLFGALGVLMVTGITIAGRVPSELIRMNYDSIAYAQEMVRAMTASSSRCTATPIRSAGKNGLPIRWNRLPATLPKRPSGRSLRIFKPHGMRTARLRTTPITGACTPASTPWFRSTSGGCSCGSARTPGSATS
ncbi:MAG: hypothetical protein ACLSAH_20505 [Bilophila wadsworthia]